MVSFRLLAGGYDVFVATYLFNATSGSLSLVRKSPTGPSPSWITLHPKNSSILYAVNQVAEGGLQSFSISPDGSLSEAKSNASSGGNSPNFAVALSTGEVAVTNYVSGTARLVPTDHKDPLSFSEQDAPAIAFPQPIAPSTSHPHHVVEHRGEVFVPDLGGDKIWRLRQISLGNYKIQGFIPQPVGSGPRHIAISYDRLFAVHELASTLTVQHIPSAPNGTDTQILASLSTLPSDQPIGALWAAAEIVIPKPTRRFPIPYIYVTNRNTGVQDPRGDTIAIFEHVGKGTKREGLKLVNQVYTGVEQPRGMALGPYENGGDEYIAVGGVAGTGGIVVFRRTEGGRSLEVVARNLEVPTRTSFVWLQDPAHHGRPEVEV